MFSIGALLFFLIPCYLLIWILSGLKALREKRDHLPIQDTNITLIIAFRDEASQIPKLLESLSKLNLLEGDEIYLVDDHSSDGGISSNRRSIPSKDR
jgi:hypothetical protein